MIHDLYIYIIQYWLMLCVLHSRVAPLSQDGSSLPGMRSSVRSPWPVVSFCGTPAATTPPATTVSALWRPPSKLVADSPPTRLSTCLRRSVVRWIPLGCLSVVTVRYVVMGLSLCCEVDTSRLSVCSHCQVCSHGPVTVLCGGYLSAVCL